MSWVTKTLGHMWWWKHWAIHVLKIDSDTPLKSIKKKVQFLAIRELLKKHMITETKDPLEDHTYKIWEQVPPVAMATVFYMHRMEKQILKLSFLRAFEKKIHKWEHWNGIGYNFFQYLKAQKRQIFHQIHNYKINTTNFNNFPFRMQLKHAIATCIYLIARVKKIIATCNAALTTSIVLKTEKTH